MLVSSRALLINEELIFIPCWDFSVLHQFCRVMDSWNHFSLETYVASSFAFFGDMIISCNNFYLIQVSNFLSKIRNYLYPSARILLPLYRKLRGNWDCIPLRIMLLQVSSTFVFSIHSILVPILRKPSMNIINFQEILLP